MYRSCDLKRCVQFQMLSSERLSVPYKLVTQDGLVYRRCSHASVLIILIDHKALWEHIKASILEKFRNWAFYWNRRFFNVERSLEINLPNELLSQMKKQHQRGCTLFESTQEWVTEIWSSEGHWFSFYILCLAFKTVRLATLFTTLHLVSILMGCVWSA